MRTHQTETGATYSGDAPLQQRQITVVAILVAAGFNVAGIRALGLFTELMVIAELVVVLGVTTLVVLFGHHQGLDAMTNTGGTASSFNPLLPGFLGGGIFLALWVF